MKKRCKPIKDMRAMRQICAKKKVKRAPYKSNGKLQPRTDRVFTLPFILQLLAEGLFFLLLGAALSGCPKL